MEQDVLVLFTFEIGLDLTLDGEAKVDQKRLSLIVM